MCRSPVHVTAADPARPRRHAHLVAGAVIAYHRAHGVRAVTVVIAGHGRVGGTEVWGSLVNRIVPGVVVIGAGAIPAVVLLVDGRVTPVVAGVLTADDGALTGVTGGPDLRHDLQDIPLHTLRGY